MSTIILSLLTFKMCLQLFFEIKLGQSQVNKKVDVRQSNILLTFSHPMLRQVVLFTAFLFIAHNIIKIKAALSEFQLSILLAIFYQKILLSITIDFFALYNSN